MDFPGSVLKFVKSVKSVAMVFVLNPLQTVSERYRCRRDRSALISEEGTENLPEQRGALNQQVEQVFTVDPQRNPVLCDAGVKLEIDPGERFIYSDQRRRGRR